MKNCGEPMVVLYKNRSETLTDPFRKYMVTTYYENDKKLY